MKSTFGGFFFVCAKLKDLLPATTAASPAINLSTVRRDKVDFNNILNAPTLLLKQVGQHYAAGRDTAGPRFIQN